MVADDLYCFLAEAGYVELNGERRGGEEPKIFSLPCDR